MRTRTTWGELPKDKHFIISQKGGRSRAANGTGHQWTREEAKEAGRRGGLAKARRQHENNQGE